MTTSTTSEIELRFCSHCKYLLGVRYKTEQAENWSCVHPSNLVKNERRWNLVTGIQEYLREYHEGSLFVLRSESKYCGPEGKWYEEYQEPERYDVGKLNTMLGGKEVKELIETPFSPEALEDIKKKAEANRERRRQEKLKGPPNFGPEDL